MNSESIGSRIKEARISANMSVNEFAKSLNISASHLRNIENACSNPSTRLLLRISNTYSVSVDWLIIGAGEMHKTSVQNMKV
jgi:Predicted transcriptional regulators